MNGVALYPVVELIRIEENEEFGTFGVLRINKQAFCVTLEPADRENAVGMSSIPAQQYKIRRHRSSKFGETYQVEAVPNRTEVLFHSGNQVEETEGCILVAQHFGKLGSARAVLNSGATFSRFMAAMDGFDVASLTIREVF